MVARVDLGRGGLFLLRVLPDIADDAHDLPIARASRARALVERDPLAHGIAAREVAARERLVHHDFERPIGAIREEAAAAQGHAGRREVARARHAPSDGRIAQLRAQVAARDQHRLRLRSAAQGQAVDHAHALHARQGGERLKRSRVEALELAVLGAPGRMETDGKHVLGAETEFAPLHRDEAPREQRGGHQQKQAKGDLARDEAAPDPELRRAGARGASSVAQPLDHLAANRLPRGNHAEHNAAEQREDDRESGDAPVERHHFNARQFRGQSLLEDLDQEGGGQQARDRATCGEPQAFDQIEANHGSRARAQRHPHRRFPLAFERARRKEACDVQARHQQHDADGGEQDVQRLASFARNELLERDHARRESFVGIRIRAPQAARDGVDLRLHGGRRHAFFQAADHGEPVARASLVLKARLGGEPDVEIRRIGHRRQDPNHLERLAPQRQRTAQDLRISAEAALPKGVAQDRDRCSFRAFLGFRERPAQDRLHAKHLQRRTERAIRFDELGACAFRLHHDPLAVGTRERREGSRLRPPVLQARRIGAHPVAIRGLLDQDQLARVRQRQRL